MNQIVSDFLTRLDQTGIGFVEQIYRAMATELGSIFRLILLLYVVWWGYDILRGRSSAMPLELAERLGRVVFVYAVATRWDVFATLIFEVVTKTPENLGNLIVDTIRGSGSAGTEAGRSAVLNAFNTLYDAGVRLVGTVYTGTFYDIFGALLAAIILVAAMLFLGLALGILVAAKLLTYITLALAPIFIILAVFGITFRFTQGYVNLLVSLMISVILLYAFVGFYIEIVNVVIGFTGSAGTGVAQKIGQVVPFIFVCICGFYVVLQIPSIAFAIAGAAADATQGGRAALFRSARLSRATTSGAVVHASAGARRGLSASRWAANRLSAPAAALPGPSALPRAGAADAMRRTLAENAQIRT